MTLMLTFGVLILMQGCSLNMGNIPIIIKEHPNDEVDYGAIKKIQSQTSLVDSKVQDCMHLFIFIPTKLTLDLKYVLKNSCPNSNYSFNNKIDDHFFYLGYGRECVRNHAKCTQN